MKIRSANHLCEAAFRAILAGCFVSLMSFAHSANALVEATFKTGAI